MNLLNEIEKKRVLIFFSWSLFLLSYISTFPKFTSAPSLSFRLEAASQTSSFIVRVDYDTRLVESHSGARGNILAGPPNIFTGLLWGIFFWIFFFQNGAFWRTLYFWPTAKPTNVARPGVAYPLPLPRPLNGPVWHLADVVLEEIMLYLRRRRRLTISWIRMCDTLLFQAVLTMIATWIIGPAYNIAYMTPSAAILPNGHCTVYSEWPDSVTQSVVGVLTICLLYTSPSPRD